jgi:hypothetical protein
LNPDANGGFNDFGAQSQSQFSEFEDNMSSVVMNYENLKGLLSNEVIEGRNNGNVG